MKVKAENMTYLLYVGSSIQFNDNINFNKTGTAESLF